MRVIRPYGLEGCQLFRCEQREGDACERQSSHQLRSACAGFAGGTSGSPWMSAFDPRTRTGTIGGYQQGGDSDTVSYSVYLDERIERLYRQAGGYSSREMSAPMSLNR